MDASCAYQCPKSPLTEFSRKFVPSDLYPPGFELVSTNHEDPQSGWTYVPCWASNPRNNYGRLTRHSNALIVAVAAAFRSDQAYQVRSAIGVYFAADSKWNSSTLLGILEGNETAALHACLIALNSIHQIKCIAMETLQSVVVKTHSTFLVEAMTELVFRWRANGFKNSEGKDLVNQILHRALDDRILKLSALGVQIFFWQVSKWQNNEAGDLAFRAL